MRSTHRTKAQAALLAVCAAAGLAICTNVRAAEEPAHSAALDDAIIAAAKRHGVPERLVRRIIMRESKYNATARNHKYWGLMQISYPTARSMGFKGTPQQLLNPVVNLRYAVPYLANAFICAGKREDAAVRLYAAGYYFTARTRGLINSLRTADSTPLNGVQDEPQEPVLASNAVAQPAQSVGVFGALFSPGQDPQAEPQAQAQPQVAALSADAGAAPRPATASEPSAAPSGTFKGKTVAMEVNKKGELAPPKKWTRDGGMTVIGRGEQGLDKVASRDATHGEASDDSNRARKSRRHARKFTLVASLDTPPSAAQAYATPGQDPRFVGAPSQTAISQATAGQPMPGQPVAVQPVDPQGAAATQPGAQSADAGMTEPGKAEPSTAEDKPTKRRRSRRARRHKSGSQTQVAESKPAEPAPALRSTATQ